MYSYMLTYLAKMWKTHLPLALSIPVYCVYKIMSASRGFPVHCRAEILFAILSVCWKEAELKRWESLLRSSWLQPTFFAVLNLPGWLFCYCCVSVQRGTHRLVQGTHSAALAGLCPWRVSNFLLIFFPSYISSSARFKNEQYRKCLDTCKSTTLPPTTHCCLSWYTW